MRQIETRTALPAIIDVPGELESELRIVGRQVAGVVGYLLGPFRVWEGLPGDVVHEPTVFVHASLTGIAGGGFDVLRMCGVFFGLDDRHMKVGKGLHGVSVDLRRK